LACKKIIELTNSKSVIVNKTLPSDAPKRKRVDLTLARKKLNYDPKISIEEGLIKTIEYFKIKGINSRQPHERKFNVDSF
jgi:UDP-glucuronate decarboxylase